eukprot:Lithocolla_globosa_v1_NODE_70_length_7053_cov_4.426408.p5 type:complete len:205 gc:universal NODE_70_length_7053_cov_4.426408:3691-3077(-)
MSREYTCSRFEDATTEEPGPCILKGVHLEKFPGVCGTVFHSITPTFLGTLREDRLQGRARNENNRLVPIRCLLVSGKFMCGDHRAFLTWRFDSLSRKQTQTSFSDEQTNADEKLVDAMDEKFNDAVCCHPEHSAQILAHLSTPFERNPTLTLRPLSPSELQFLGVTVDIVNNICCACDDTVQFPPSPKRIVHQCCLLSESLLVD